MIKQAINSTSLHSIQIAILHPICRFISNSIQNMELNWNLKGTLNSILNGQNTLTSLLCSMQMQFQYGCSLSGNVFIYYTPACLELH